MFTILRAGGRRNKNRRIIGFEKGGDAAVGSSKYPRQRQRIQFHKRRCKRSIKVPDSHKSPEEWNLGRRRRGMKELTKEKNERLRPR